MTAAGASTAAPVPGPVRRWLLAARPHTLPAAVAPVLVGTAAGVREAGALQPLPFVGAMLGALLLQVATNLANDYSDFHRGADTADRMGPTRATQSGLLTARQVRNGIVVTFALAVVVGLYLAWVGGWPIVAIGVASIVCGLAYTGGPWPYGYHGLGDLFVFVFFGLVAVCGSAYLQGGLGPLAVAASVPVGLLATDILVVNNLRDLPTDVVAGKRTLAVRMGARATRWQYALLLLVAYLVPVVLVSRRLADWWALLPWLTLPLALALARRVLAGTAGRALNEVLARTGRLQLAFSVLLAVGVVI